MKRALSSELFSTLCLSLGLLAFQQSAAADEEVAERTIQSGVTTDTSIDESSVATAGTKSSIRDNLSVD